MFIIVLWIAFGLVSLALYFSHSMISELRASENRASGMAAEEAIMGAERYISSVLANQIAVGSNGFALDPSAYLNEAVPVGDSHFWLIGRDTNFTTGPGVMSFGLVDEASKINLNSASSNVLYDLVDLFPNSNPDMSRAIMDWRNTNSAGEFQGYYSMQAQPYQTKGGPFESIDELRMIYGADQDSLVGDDMNRNGILDPDENDLDHNGQINPGMLEYVTVFSREPNIGTNGGARINISAVTAGTVQLQNLLQQALGSSRANQIMQNLGVGTGGGGSARGRTPGVTATASFRSPLEFYRASRMTAAEFGQIADQITVTNGSYIEGRININTASPEVLECLPGLDTNPSYAQSLLTYRQQNPDKLGSIAWIVDALGQGNSSALDALQTSDCITTRSYQVSADVAALGPNGRGYRRIRFVFDTSDGTPRVVYCQDLTSLGWALGKDVREAWLATKPPQ
ncbi:MAG TPA: hypothetical protein VHH88_04405 [Verrucomicrobiae bacterium]|nr:hypothetical protein [Verrucomicrobiae bacterium]